MQHTIVKRGRDVKLVDISLILYFHRRSFPGMCCPTYSCSYASKSRTAPKSFSIKCLIEIGNGSSLQAILIACKYGEWRIMKYIRRRSQTSFYCSALTLALREVIPTVKHPVSYSTQTFCTSSESRFFKIIVAFWPIGDLWGRPAGQLSSIAFHSLSWRQNARIILKNRDTEDVQKVCVE